MSSPIEFTVVAAWTRRMGIGKNGTLPWPYLKADMARFASITKTPPSEGRMNAVIMGRRTWESLPANRRPLPGRINVVLTTQASKRAEIESPHCFCASSFAQALAQLTSAPVAPLLGSVFVIGGSSVFAEALKHPGCVKVAGTEILTHFECDTYMPHPTAQGFVLPPPPPPPSGTEAVAGAEVVVTENGVAYQFLDYVPSQERTEQFQRDIRVSKREVEEEAKVSTSAAATTSDSSARAINNDVDDDDEDDTASAAASAAAVALSCAADPQSFVQAALSLPLTRARLLPPSLAQQQQHANPEEAQYLHLVAAIIAAGETRGDRTGTGTRSRFGAQMRFSLRDGRLPLLTTKRVFWRGVCEELLWFIKGCTDARVLADKGVRIWDGNGSRAFLDKVGQGHRQEMDLGPVYGFQWRHFGAKYVDAHTDYTGKGADQLADIVRLLREEPTSRRIILSAWNPVDLSQMALPPCHVLSQFYVSATGELSCQLYQRSADMGLGVPFNIASYALLTHLLARVSGLKAGELVHTIGDAHVYLNHVRPLREQVRRVPKQFPRLVIKGRGGAEGDGLGMGDGVIDGYVFEDFEVVGYNPDKAVPMKMAV